MTDQCRRNAENRPEITKIMKILKQHGATFEEEPGSICYQRGHKKRSGKLCWHKSGKSNPRCSWFFDDREDQQKPGVLEQVKNLLSREQPGSSKSEEKTAPSESQERLAPLSSEK
jgi:hypothetical protein